MVEGSGTELVDMDETGLGDDVVIGEVVKSVSGKTESGVMMPLVGRSVISRLLHFSSFFPKPSTTNGDPLSSSRFSRDAMTRSMMSAAT